MYVHFATGEGSSNKLGWLLMGRKGQARIFGFFVDLEQLSVVLL